MTLPLRIAALLAPFLLLSASGCPTGPSGPTMEDCTDDGPGGGLGGGATLELGAPGDGAFTPLTDGQILGTQRGGQGFQMVVFRLRIRGATVPACLTTKVRVQRDNETEALADSQSSVLTHARNDGSYDTANIFVIMGFGDIAGNAITIEATAAGVSATRRVFADSIETDGGLLPD